jgi:hypothetical protein
MKIPADLCQIFGSSRFRKCRQKRELSNFIKILVCHFFRQRKNNCSEIDRCRDVWSQLEDERAGWNGDLGEVPPHGWSPHRHFIDFLVISVKCLDWI